ncbi:MAG TPA: phosphate regulon sensor histidine kinase PhoR, partial [Sutterella wadsworthensis]|nr:phosphate regulon sensor histidine kinase PhoR [Sutterella wadsworthensis]
IGRSFFDVVTDERLRHWLFERNFAGRCNYTSKAGLDLDVSVVAPDSRHMMIVTHDVTERLRIDEMRRDFVANVS